MMTVEEAIRTKRAVRQFTPQSLPDDAIYAILNAGRRAQSSKNSQPWQFVAISDRDTLTQLSHTGDFAGHLAGAALGVALVAPEDPERQDWLMFDLGQAASYMQLAAWALGIGSCIATIYQPEQAQALLGISAGWRCDVALSFGYPAEGTPPSRRHMPEAKGRAGVPRYGGRKPLEELVHWDRW